MPGGRTLAAGGLLLAAGVAAYLLSTATSLFAVRAIAVSGGSPAVGRQVEDALAATRGRSLVGLDVGALRGTVEALPTIASVSFDRAFPNTLRVHVVPERVVGVVRQGAGGYLVSARGRIVAGPARDASPGLPRIWAARTDGLVVGQMVPRSLAPAVRAVAPLGRVRFPGRIVAVRSNGAALSLRLASGLLVQLGAPDDVTLKLAVAGRVIPLVADDATYLDVSVPERPVAGNAASTGDRPSPEVETSVTVSG